ncbi:hypothetical protein PRIPAC_72386 [Pristionchus pacificus]|uniref:Uncharacterized protein n=1 Tax=Pristionchus pacificus TaxID=54126 RepID=A0A2A6BGI2_PRIPA|nr:hypothetical protein PRIPAC_72386 [Pristionchus pacificus]|eukprot:PDM64921.1 hypothetical protein PRIPAC_53177 [Pristionchus pacificus]
MQSTSLLLLLGCAFAVYAQSTTPMSTTQNNQMMQGGRGQRPTPSPEQRAQMDAQKQAYIATLSSGAQSAARQIDQLKQQIDQIYNAQTASVQQELDSIHKMGGKGGRGGMGMMNGMNNGYNNNNGNNGNNGNQGR